MTAGVKWGILSLSIPLGNLERKDLMTMKQWKQRGLTCLLLTFLLLALSGCGDTNEPGGEEGTSGQVESVVYPVTINGSEIRVGETTVQTLLDAGFKITTSEKDANMQITQYEIDPDTELDAESYYSGASIWVTDNIFAHVSMVTEEATKLGNAVIARMEFSLASGQDDPGLANILFNNVPVTELNREKAGEMFPDFTGDDVMWFSPAEMRDYEYFMSFSMEDGSMTKFSAEKQYDVDWLNTNGN